MPTNVVTTDTYQPEHVRFAHSPEPITEIVAVPTLTEDIPEGTLMTFVPASGGAPATWKPLEDLDDDTIDAVLGAPAETGDKQLSLFTFGNFNVRWTVSDEHDDSSTEEVWQKLQAATVGSGIFLHVPAEQPFAPVVI